MSAPSPALRPAPAPDVPLARFTVNKEIKIHPKTKEQSVSPVLFLPDPEKEHGGRLALSTFRVDGLDGPAIRARGEQWVMDTYAPVPQRTLRGYAVVETAAVQKQGLVPDPDDTPPGHVNVIGWPEDEAKRDAIAVDLAAAAEEGSLFERF